MGKLTLDEYMDLLIQRQKDYVAKHPGNGLKTKFPVEPLYEWFIREGDEHLVDMDAIDAALKPEPRPAKPKRERRPVDIEALIARRDKLTAERDRIGGAGSDDPASINLSPNSRNRAAARAGRRRFAQMDRDLERYTKLTRQIDQLNSRITRDQARRAA